jgi:hypothetical protein
MSRKATRQKRLDLWLDEADLNKLTTMADGWQVSWQRIIESALTYATTANLQPTTNRVRYIRQRRIPVNLDGLALAQVLSLTENTEASEGIRMALRAFYTVQASLATEHATVYNPPTQPPAAKTNINPVAGWH